jgi:hypothetical protein
MLLLMLMLLLLLLLLLPPLHWPLNHPCAAEGVTHAVDMRVLICFCMSATAAAVLLKLGVRCSGSEKLCKCSVYAADNPWEQPSQVVPLQHGLCLADTDANCCRVCCCTSVVK